MMKTKTGMILTVLPFAVVLTGCGGGGGGSSSATLGGFTSFSSATRGSPISLSGMSSETTYTYDLAAEKVTSLGATSAVADGATANIIYDSNGQPTAAQLVSANGTMLSFNAANGDTFGYLIINPSIDVVHSGNLQNIVFSASPYDFGWDYQTFGTWETGGGTGSGTVGVISVGAATAAGSIPTTGTATYSGYTGGRYGAVNGDEFFTSSNLSATANFAARAVVVTSTGTQVTPDLINVSNNNNLDFTGNLAYSSGSNQFTGNITTTGGLNGSMTGKFYGPTAQEIGGIFSARANAGLEGYLGAFGAKR